MVGGEDEDEDVVVAAAVAALAVVVAVLSDERETQDRRHQHGCPGDKSAVTDRPTTFMDKAKAERRFQVGGAGYDTIAKDLSLFTEPGVFWGVGSAYKIKKSQVPGFLLRSWKAGKFTRLI